VLVCAFRSQAYARHLFRVASGHKTRTNEIRYDETIFPRLGLGKVSVISAETSVDAKVMSLPDVVDYDHFEDMISFLHFRC